MSMDTEASPNLPRLVTAQEVAQQTGLALQRVYSLSRSGTLPAIRFGRTLRFDPEAVAAFFAAGGTGPRG